MLAGRCREMVRIQRPERVVDATGSISTKWQTVGTTSIEVEPETAGEQWSGEKVTHVVTHKAACRWNPLINADCRLVSYEPNHDGSKTVYAIVGVWPVDNRRKDIALKLSAESMTPEDAG